MDVLEGGSGRSPPRWLWLVAWFVALTAVGAYAAVRSDGTGVAGPAASPAVGPASSRAAQPSPPGPSSWPSVAGACGSTAYRPLASPQPLTVRTGVRLLVGGHGLRLVDADTGVARATAGVPASAQQTVAEVVSARGKVYALSAECNVGVGRLYRVEGGEARPFAGAPAARLIAGVDRVWAVDHPDSAAGPAAPLRMRLLESTRSLTLPPRAYPVADSDAALVVAIIPPDPASTPPRIVALDPATGRSLRSFGTGYPLAVGRTDLLLVAGACTAGDATSSCTVSRVEIRTGRVHGRYPLPKGRVPVLPGSLSGDGDRVAFQLSRPSGDPRLDPSLPLPPSDIAVLRLDDGQLETVPGLEMARGTGVGLVFAGTGSWLFVSASHGDHSHLYAWRSGVRAPVAIARLPGPVTGAPPLLGS